MAVRKDRITSYIGWACIALAFALTVILTKIEPFVPLLCAGVGVLYLTTPVREILIRRNPTYVKPNRRATLAIDALALGVIISLANAAYGTVFRSNPIYVAFLFTGIAFLIIGEWLWVIFLRSNRKAKPP